MASFGCFIDSVLTSKYNCNSNIFKKDIQGVIRESLLGNKNALYLFENIYMEKVKDRDNNMRKAVFTSLCDIPKDIIFLILSYIGNIEDVIANNLKQMQLLDDKQLLIPVNMWAETFVHKSRKDYRISYFPEAKLERSKQIICLIMYAVKNNVSIIEDIDVRRTAVLLSSLLLSEKGIPDFLCCKYYSICGDDKKYAAPCNVLESSVNLIKSYISEAEAECSGDYENINTQFINLMLNYSSNRICERVANEFICENVKDLNVAKLFLQKLEEVLIEEKKTSILFVREFVLYVIADGMKKNRWI